MFFLSVNLHSIDTNVLSGRQCLQAKVSLSWSVILQSSLKQLNLTGSLCQKEADWLWILWNFLERLQKKEKEKNGRRWMNQISEIKPQWPNHLARLLFSASLWNGSISATSAESMSTTGQAHFTPCWGDQTRSVSPLFSLAVLLSWSLFLLWATRLSLCLTEKDTGRTIHLIIFMFSIN